MNGATHLNYNTEEVVEVGGGLSLSPYHHVGIIAS